MCIAVLTTRRSQESNAVRVRVLVCSWILLAITCGNLLAQPDGPTREGRGPDRSGRKERSPFGGGPKIETWRVLELKSVRAELKLTDAQVAAIGRLRTELRNPANKQSKEDWKKLWEALTPEERSAKFEEFKTESARKKEKFESELKQILDASQFTRMRQIQLQIRGLAALFDKEVASAIALRPQQKTDIHESVRSSMRKAMHEYFRTDRSERKMSIREKMRTIQPAVEEKALEVLTAEQIEKFNAMKGAAFEISDDELRRSGRHGRPPKPPRDAKRRDGPPTSPTGEVECGKHRK